MTATAEETARVAQEIAYQIADQVRAQMIAAGHEHRDADLVHYSIVGPTTAAYTAALLAHGAAERARAIEECAKEFAALARWQSGDDSPLVEYVAAQCPGCAANIPINDKGRHDYYGTGLTAEYGPCKTPAATRALARSARP